MSKTDRIFQIILALFCIILLRIWQLEVVQRDEKKRLSEGPKRRTLVQKANRGILTDRFGMPLAINKICYNATIYYNQIGAMPAIGWKTDETGKRVRYHPRKEYIQALSKELDGVLGLSAQRIEDLIHAKASLLPHAPFRLKTHLTEEEHYKLALMEKDWPGVQAEISSERFYPQGKVGSGVIGTLGYISSKEYRTIAEEMKTLQRAIEDWETGKGTEWPPQFSSLDQMIERLQELKEKAYTLQDLVGKSGIEGQFEEDLRGYFGKKLFEVDQKGRFVRELPGGKEAIEGQEIRLSLSLELQSFAESLLIQDEATREGRSFGTDLVTKERKTLKQPWIKGGSIVAMDPKTGEVLAFATTPRFDPNDFIACSDTGRQKSKQERIARWLENEKAIGAIWDGTQNLIRERYSPSKGFHEESVLLTWERYLSCLFPPESPLALFFRSVDTVKGAISVQEDVEKLLYHASMREVPLLLKQWRLEFWKERGGEALSAFRRLDALFTSIPSEEDRLFAIDLCRLVVHAPAFTDESIRLLGEMKLSAYRALNQQVCRLEASLKEKATAAFREGFFQVWKEANQKKFLADIRQREKVRKIPPRPYIEYLDQKERDLFHQFWKEERLSALAIAIEGKEGLASFNLEECKAALHTFRQFSELERPLLGSYPFLRKKKREQLEKALAAAFYPLGGHGYLRSYAYQASSPQGSIFKLAAAYAALAQTKGENPLTIIDEWQYGSSSVATTLSGTPYPRMYKGGRLPRSHFGTLGKVDLISAIEQSSNPYFSILTVDVLKDPTHLNLAASALGLGACTGIDLPQESAGRLPSDLEQNRTGLYSTAIGQHTLLSTPLQTAVMLAAIANRGQIVKPTLALRRMGLKPKRESPQGAEVVHVHQPSALRSIPLDSKARSLLLEGMDRVVWGAKGSARASVIKALSANVPLLTDYLKLKHQMIGKTSTAEILFNPYCYPSSTPNLYKHIWFGAISFNPSSKGRWEDPELVVVVYLRYGDGGKEAAPLAAQVIHKWREIRSSSSVTKK